MTKQTGPDDGTLRPLAGFVVYLHADVRGKRREIFAEKLPALGAGLGERVGHVIARDVRVRSYGT